MRAAFSPRDLGKLFRQTRKALGRSQAEVAGALNVRRQTIAELERGANVGMHVLLNGLAYLGKGVAIVDTRPTAEEFRAMIEDEE
ncbi:helix-turn-helix domain-containing protein [Cupriavidus sp. AU9028]|nr:helix-turn-helix domain-containing protein [Cupriavidus sp. AU9028]MBY4899236.1 helix-turn-helix domain-containing protein [Cupriavidus sp. AU9028]